MNEFLCELCEHWTPSNELSARKYGRGTCGVSGFIVKQVKRCQLFKLSEPTVHLCATCENDCRKQPYVERCADYFEKEPKSDDTMVEKLIRQECDALCEMLLEKNKRYGNSALEPLRCFSSASTDEQLRVRIDDKLSRMIRGEGAELEDVELDLMGYLVILRVWRKLNQNREVANG